MAQLWGGRFTKQTDQLVFDFNASITFDKRLFYEDVTGSIVHATMLARSAMAVIIRIFFIFSSAI